MTEPQYMKLEIFIPETHFHQLQEVLQQVNAGRIGGYDSCLAYSRVTGMWRPLVGTEPYQGDVGEIFEGAELKVEVRIEAANLEKTLSAIRAVHPYEEPVVFALPLCT